MMKNVVFKVDNKELYEDQVLLDYIYPVLFTCVDDFDNMYISVCYDADISKTCWLLAKVKPVQVIDLLENKITIREMFECDDLWNICKLSHSSEKNVEKIKDYKTFDSKAFPAKGEYMDADEGEFSEEIEIFKNRIPLSNYEIKQEKYFTHSFSRINISLRKNPIWQNIGATYKFQKDNKEEYLCALESSLFCYTLKNVKYKDDSYDSNIEYYFQDSVKEYSNVYIS